MGYSARYHAASLAAVFLALAVGILIGAEFGDDVVSGTRQNLEQSLTGDLEAARERADELDTQLDRSREFEERVYPVLVGDLLEGRRIGVLGLGGLPGDLSEDIEAALDPTDARLVAVGVVREPPDLSGLAGELENTRFTDLETNQDTVGALGTGVGRQLAVGGTLLERIRSQLLSRASGQFSDLDALVVVRDQPGDLDPEQRAITGRLEKGLLDGVGATGLIGVGVERSDSEPSSIGAFEDADLSSVDNLDEVAGRVALVSALLGAEGSFGQKESADQLLPDLLTPAPVAPPAEIPPPRGRGRGAGALRD
jgi:hypothetical protein